MHACTDISSRWLHSLKYMDNVEWVGGLDFINVTIFFSFGNQISKVMWKMSISVPSQSDLGQCQLYYFLWSFPSAKNLLRVFRVKWNERIQVWVDRSLDQYYEQVREMLRNRMRIWSFTDCCVCVYVFVCVWQVESRKEEFISDLGEGSRSERNW